MSYKIVRSKSLANFWNSIGEVYAATGLGHLTAVTHVVVDGHVAGERWRRPGVGTMLLVGNLALSLKPRLEARRLRLLCIYGRHSDVRELLFSKDGFITCYLERIINYFLNTGYYEILLENGSPIKIKYGID